MTVIDMKFWTVGDHPVTRPDCLIVLSYAVESNKRLTKPTQAAINAADKIWKKNPRAVVIFSTGDNQGLGIPNSRVMAAYGRRLGIPTESIIEEDKSLTTYENLLFSFQIARKLKCRKILFVAYDLHIRRMLAIARKMKIYPLYWISATSAGSPAYGIKRFQTYSRLTILVYEMIAYIYNWFKREL
ncbi:hypothetical protein A2154_01405 [Candidatus Gottesmanbacteria bacterium RBG_16_43_7]|uniref:DUF218 domain-containing protein n=1 Tax=Candidatus Gottesmanbacteria bacterium RBG_16_43_7 TaxID=1798373 RepID=A0A1F5ZAS2_9BACT|nr:MAG: hypothetical protein A2154_01405 [Candidatus Gottesmanbacteria bacterium RBG_16_43_7]